MFVFVLAVKYYKNRRFPARAVGENANLDGMGFSPFATVTAGMDVVDKIYQIGAPVPMDASME
jgi:hypothetical protein